jgi:SAM-dependent methyltransferase
VAAHDDRECWLNGVPFAQAIAYSRFIEPAIFGPWADVFVDWAGVTRGDRVVDVGSGSGSVARRVEHFLGDRAEIVGIDYDPEMIALARTPAPAGIRWVQADAQALPFGGEQFDLVVCHQALQFVPDRHAALNEMHRVLRRAGRVVLAVWAPIERSPASAALADAIERHISAELAARYRAGPFGYGSLDTLRADLAASGFADADVDERELLATFDSVPLFARVYGTGGLFVQAGADARRRMLDELEARLEPYSEHGRLSYPTTAYLAKAVR